MIKKNFKEESVESDISEEDPDTLSIEDLESDDFTID